MFLGDQKRKLGKKRLNTVRNKDSTRTYPAGNYIFKVNNRNTRARCEICSKLMIKTPFWYLYC